MPKNSLKTARTGDAESHSLLILVNKSCQNHTSTRYFPTNLPFIPNKAVSALISFEFLSLCIKNELQIKMNISVCKLFLLGVAVGLNPAGDTRELRRLLDVPGFPEWE